MKRKIFLFVISLSLVFVQSTECFAVAQKQVVEEVDFTPYDVEFTQEMWHYSDGYWILNPGTDDEVTITELEVAQAINIRNYLVDHYIQFRIPLPSYIINRFSYGDTVTFELISSEKKKLSELFIEESIYGNIEGNYIYLFAKPILNLFDIRHVDEYVKKLSVSLPLVDYHYGNNLYEIYQSGTRLGVSEGWYDTTENKDRPNINEPYMHPGLIRSYSGLLKATKKISINHRKSEYPNEYTVGNGTFKKGGGFGCSFDYPLSINFTAYHTKWVYYDDDPVEPPTPPTPPTPEDPGDSGETTQTEDEDNKEGETTEVVSPLWRIHRTRNNL